NQALRHRGRRSQERARDFLGLEPAQRSERERDARAVGECRMTTGEDQAQALVAQLARRVALRACVIALGHTNQLFTAIVETALTPDAIDRLVTRDADDPRARVLRKTVAAPLLDG